MLTKRLLGGNHSSIFGSGSSYGNITGAATYDSGTGTWNVTGAATVDIQSETGTAMLMCRNIIVNAGTLTVTTNCKGLILFASESVQVLNGGTIHINKLGKAGNFGNLTAGLLAKRMGLPIRKFIAATNRQREYCHRVWCHLVHSNTNFPSPQGGGEKSNRGQRLPQQPQCKMGIIK